MSHFKDSAATCNQSLYGTVRTETTALQKVLLDGTESKFTTEGRTPSLLLIFFLRCVNKFRLCLQGGCGGGYWAGHPPQRKTRRRTSVDAAVKVRWGSWAGSAQLRTFMVIVQVYHPGFLCSRSSLTHRSPAI